MLYGIWLTPVAFCVLYVMRFDSWVMSEADLARFRKLVDQTERARGASENGEDGDSEDSQHSGESR